MKRFHTTPDWEGRLNIVREMEQPELRAHGIRTVFLNAPETVSDILREQIDQRLADERFTLETDRPWTTIGKLMQELDEMQEKDPDDAELQNIRKWALETYPIANLWEAHKAAGVADETPEADTIESQVRPTEIAATSPASAEKVPKAPAETSVTAVGINYLDGLD